ncbi:protein ARV1, putative [Plasmodium chabaudi adami]|uniref:Protein ARV n=1 Tax=Plasmodium chabaudi adami TaxID=5826 RepID=A0A1C6YI61_PLACE|nr:protein ARV1, putative [Plasmodium chabaudi adami]
MICIKCGRCNSQIYTIFDKSNIKLNKCHDCNKICDEYIEKNPFIIFMNILFLRPEIYRHIVFNRLKYSDKFIHVFFLKIIIIFLIINVYLHPKFENDNANYNKFTNIFLMNTDLDIPIQNTSPSYNCSSYTLFAYKYNEKNNLYGLYNIFHNSNISNLVNIYKNKLLTCIFDNKFKNENVCIPNKYNKYADHDEWIINLLLHNNKNSRLNTHSGHKCGMIEDDEIDEKKQKNDNNIINTKQTSDNSISNTKRQYGITEYLENGINFIKNKIKYESIFYMKKRKTLLKNNLITFNDFNEYTKLKQTINVHIYDHNKGYKITFNHIENKKYDINYIISYLRNIFFYEQNDTLKNSYFENEGNVYIQNDNNNDVCEEKQKYEFNVFEKKNSMCYEYENNEYNINGLENVCPYFLKNINLVLDKTKMANDIKDKQNMDQDNFSVEQISMYSKILYSNLDNEKYILKICNSSFSLKKLKLVTINYLLYFLFLCAFTYIFKLYQQRKYKINITMVKYNYLFMLFVLSNYPLVIYFILKVFNYNYINIYLNIYTLVCNIIAYHIFISNDGSYIFYSIFSVLVSYLLKTLFMIQIIPYM